MLICLALAAFGWLLFWAVFHHVPGQDWVVFHTAAAAYFGHDLALLADPRGFTEVMNRTHQAWFAQPITVLHPWVYPPVTLLLAVAFGWLSYGWSLALFLAITLAALLGALWPWAQRGADRALLLGGVLACPATAYMIGAGQLSFLIAAVVLAAMRLLPARPFCAGLIFSLLCLKPQFVPLVPLALLAGRHWRAMAGGLAGGLALVGLSAVIFGIPVWRGWIALATGANPMLGSLIEVVRVYDQSVHTCLVTLGLGQRAAGIGQILAMLLAALCVWRVFARPYAPRVRLIVLLCALVFAAPHVGDYDEILVAIAALLAVIAGGCPVWLAALAWVAPMINPPALMAVLGWPPLVWASALTPLLGVGVALSVVGRKKALLF